jgi:hypothetical protein
MITDTSKKVDKLREKTFLSFKSILLFETCLHTQPEEGRNY